MVEEREMGESRFEAKPQRSLRSLRTVHDLQVKRIVAGGAQVSSVNIWAWQVAEADARSMMRFELMRQRGKGVSEQVVDPEWLEQHLRELHD